MTLPPIPQPPEIMTRIAALATAPPATGFAGTCEAIAATFRTMAQDAYDLGDQGRGDQMQTHALRWEMVRDTGDLTLLRERP